ncbi:MAG TPA: hypothetical protein VL096_00130 [Pirellulaceae bacterium]|nr:hypothetical protein [Pirellulaceae bacterium]
MSAITLMGGTIFMRFGLHPALASLGADAQKSLAEAVRSQWAKWVMASSGFLLLSGLINTVLIIKAYKYPDVPYHALIAVKMLLALVIFFIASTLVGRSANARKFREKAAFWLNINLVLAVVVVCIGGFLRQADRIPKTPDASSVQPAVSAPAEVKSPAGE